VLIACPVDRKTAQEFVRRVHRHHPPQVGEKFVIGAMSNGLLVGVAVVGRPVARHLDNGWALEVTRLATDGTKNTCSFLYGHSARAARALGYSQIFTYTLASERGASLRAAGWTMDGAAGGGTWSRPSRPRDDVSPTEQKTRWRKQWRAGPEHAPIVFKHPSAQLDLLASPTSSCEPTGKGGTKTGS